jgi:hypothetical protein
VIFSGSTSFSQFLEHDNTANVLDRSNEVLRERISCKLNNVFDHLLNWNCLWWWPVAHVDVSDDADSSWSVCAYAKHGM